MAAGAVVLRRLQPSDADAIATLGNDWAIAQHTSDRFPHPYTIEAARAFVEAVTAAETPGEPTTFAITLGGGGLLGCAGAFRPPGGDTTKAGTLCIGYWVGRPHWGQGLATGAVRQLVDALFAEPAFAAVRRLEAHVHASNAPSLRVLEKAGFVLEGRLRQASQKRARADAPLGELVVHDLCVLGLLRSEWAPTRAR